jgi:hypothetical protein
MCGLLQQSLNAAPAGPPSRWCADSTVDAKDVRKLGPSSILVQSSLLSHSAATAGNRAVQETFLQASMCPWTHLGAGQLAFARTRLACVRGLGAATD